MGQDWAGPAALGVMVRDDGGQPVSGAAVLLRPELNPPVPPPPPFFCDAQGRLEIESLAEGEWQIEVRSSGFMIYTGYLKLTPGETPVVGFSSKQRTGTFWAPLQVTFFQPGSPVAEPTGTSKNARKQEKKRQEEVEATRRQAEKRERRLAKRREKSGRRTAVAVLEAPPATETPGAEAVRTTEEVVAEAPVPGPAEEPTEEIEEVGEEAAEQVAEVAEETVAAVAQIEGAETLVLPPPETGSEIARGADGLEGPGEPQPSGDEAEPATVGEEVATSSEVPAPIPPEPAAPAAAVLPEAAPATREPVEAQSVSEQGEVPGPFRPEASPEPEPAVASPQPFSEPERATAVADVPAAAVPEEVPGTVPLAVPAIPEPGRAPRREVPGILSRPLLVRGGACPECKPGEWALVIERLAAPYSGDGAQQAECGLDLGSRVDEVVSGAVDPAAQGLSAFAGPLGEGHEERLPRDVRDRFSQTLGRYLPATEGPCQEFVAALPEGARFVGFRYEVQDRSGVSDCLGDQECPLGKARWLSNPGFDRTATVTLVYASFFNGSPAVERRARLILYFRPPRGWEP